MATSVHRIQTAREALNEGTELAIDANQFMTVDQAIALGRALDGLRIAWLEEPVHSAALTDIEVVCDQVAIPIAYGKSERSGHVFPALQRAGVRNLQPIPSRLGSIQEWMDVMRQGADAGLRLSCGGNSFITAQFTAASPFPCQQEFLEPIIGPFRSLFKTYPTLRNGRFELSSDEPGIGVTMDWERLTHEGRIDVDKTWKR